MVSATADSSDPKVQCEAGFALGMLIRNACRQQFRILIDRVCATLHSPFISIPNFKSSLFAFLV
jgi:hypothetical protein